MLSSSSSSEDAPAEVGIRFRFGVLNRLTGDFEMGACHDKKGVALDNSKELRCVSCFMAMGMAPSISDVPGGVGRLANDVVREAP